MTDIIKNDLFGYEELFRLMRLCRDREKQIDVMQHNLVHIRKSLNITSENFGRLIGVSRRTIYSIEHGRSGMSISQYLAILYVLENDIFPVLDDDTLKCIQTMLHTKVIYSNKESK